jgi:hypothetical protein
MKWTKLKFEHKYMPMQIENLCMNIPLKNQYFKQINIS